MNIIDNIELTSEYEGDFKVYYIDNIIDNLIKLYDDVYISIILGYNFITFEFRIADKSIYYGGYTSIRKCDEDVINDYLNNKVSKRMRLHKIDKLINIIYE